MTTTDPTAGPQIVSGDYDEAAAHHDAMLREIESLRSQLAEAREQRDQAAEALVRAETERDEALCAITKIAEVLGFPGGDLREAIRALRRERDDALQEAESVGRQLHSSTREVDRLIAQLATVTEERDEARAEIARLERAAHEQGADLWIAEDRLDWLRKRVRLAMDLLCSPTVPHEPGPDVPGAYGILSHALAATAPETGPTAPQTDEQAQVRGESHTEHAGTVHDALHRIADQPATARVDLVIGLRQRGVPQHPDGPEAAALAEIDRLRTEVKQLGAEREWLADRARTMGIAEAFIAAHGPARAVIVEAGRLRAKVKHLSACVREWEAVNADLAARCDSGDIPIRPGERYSQAVLREIDRLRAALGSQKGSR